MDTKSKNIRYKLGSKILAGLVLWISAIAFLLSGIFFLNTGDYIQIDDYKESYEYEILLNDLIHNTVESATKFKHGENRKLDPNRYNTIENNLNQAVNFNFYTKDLETNKTHSKMSDAYTIKKIKEDPNSIHIKLEDGEMLVDSGNRYFYLYEDIEKMLKKSPQEIYIAVNDPPLEPGDGFNKLYTELTNIKYYAPYAMGTLAVSALVLFISLVFLILVAGRKEKDGEIKLAAVDKIYNDIQTAFVFFATLISMMFIGNVIFASRRLDRLDFMLAAIILAVDMLIGMTYFFSMLRQFKKGVLLKNTLVYKVIKKIVGLGQNIFNDKIFKSWSIALLLLYGLINGWLFRISSRNYNMSLIGIFLIIIFNILVLQAAFSKLKSLSLIMEGAKEISKGDLDYKIDHDNISLEFKDFARDIESIQGGLKNAVEEAIKGERMKTDLITNVSHDLKTPLTSIINYVDLLKQEKLDNENAGHYLQVLDEKSERLKDLIEDLIEASKASSGNITLEKSKVDLAELVNQALGEYQDKISQAKLDLISKAPDDKVLIFADGKLMWRIIENLISNVVKYSMEHSRVYIDISEKDGFGQIIIKNMSAYPLDIDPKELTDRFIRADKARTTEGSGLGLSIAQSLTSIQEGKFNIDIDGDLFKVTIDIPLYK